MPKFNDFDLDIQKSTTEIEPMSRGSELMSYCIGVCISINKACTPTEFCVIK